MRGRGGAGLGSHGSLPFDCNAFNCFDVKHTIAGENPQSNPDRKRVMGFAADRADELERRWSYFKSVRMRMFLCMSYACAISSHLFPSLFASALLQVEARHCAPSARWRSTRARSARWSTSCCPNTICWTGFCRAALADAAEWFCQVLRAKRPTFNMTEILSVLNMTN
jgi:hypothetical protein